MKFGKIDINTEVNWAKWEWKEFQDFYQNSLKGISEPIEQVAKKLGVPIPEKSKPDKKASSGDV